MSDEHGSVRAALGPHLPFLRRYARVLTGSQKSGDTYVRASLEALLAEPKAFQIGNPARLELFRLFHAFWNPAATLDTPLPEGSVGAASIGALDKDRRAALLLTAVEGFTVAEAAAILDRPAADVEADVVSARQAISSAIASRVLIIEDEPVIAMHLETIVEDMGHSVTGIATTHNEALAEVEANRPDLVLADIQLADGSSGIDAVKDILSSISVPVIFITAYPERLLTGERPEPTWLVTKPFEPDTVIATIGQALLLHQKQEEPA